jgi:hypothetical protein
MSDNKKQPLNELHLNLTGKIFFATLGAWIIGKAVNTRLRGTREQVEVVSGALLSSRKLQEELKNPNATIDSVVEKLNEKRTSAAEFEKVFGTPWPL